MPRWPAIAQALREQGIDVADAPGVRRVGGGDISAAWRVEAEAAALFIKTGPAAAAGMFEAEAEGLAELASANAVRVPGVIGCGSVGGDAFIAMEWLHFSAANARTETRFGRQLAELHRHTADRFGWHRDNTIGLTPQHNPWTSDWIGFFREHRLGFQLRLAERNGYGAELVDLGRKLADGMETLFSGYSPVPSLLHGDLWGGNWAAVDGDPAIFDPAVHYGDRECDLAMTRLFGGFGAAFYAEYENAWPLADGSEARLELYQLYHVLNHLNLFGGGYLGRAIGLLRKLCARL